MSPSNAGRTCRAAPVCRSFKVTIVEPALTWKKCQRCMRRNGLPSSVTSTRARSVIDTRAASERFERWATGATAIRRANGLRALADETWRSTVVPSSCTCTPVCTDHRAGRDARCSDLNDATDREASSGERLRGGRLSNKPASGRHRAQHRRVDALDPERIDLRQREAARVVGRDLAELGLELLAAELRDRDTVRVQDEVPHLRNARCPAQRQPVVCDHRCEVARRGVRIADDTGQDREQREVPRQDVHDIAATPVTVLPGAWERARVP